MGAAGLAPLLALGWAAPAGAQGMTLPGKFGVGATGAATYSIPIVAPPGTAGMVPSLALAYSSQGGNGVLGVGWALEGLPAIGRCPRTFAQDGVRGSVRYDANDRFCLDGQRLVVTTGTYGANGAEYRTEIESFSKITSFGVAGTGPAWFQVRTKSGQILEFGNTTDSRVLAQGKTTVRSWSVNKVSDTKGNYLTVTYTQDTPNGQAYPNRVDYTGNASAGLAVYNSVRFTYNTSRPDSVPLYVAGSLLKTTVLLTNVQTFAGSAMVADYRLTYAQSPATGASRLTSVQLCDPGSVCLPATSFAWQDGGTGVTVVSNVAGQDGNLAGSRPYVGDFNGDGKADILWDAEANVAWPSSTGTRVLWTSTGNGTFSVDSNFAGQNGTLVGYAPAIADFNRDGRPDIWWYQVNGSNGQTVGLTSKWWSTSSGTFAVSAGPWLGAGYGMAAVADINADSLADTFWLAGSSVSALMTKADGTFSSTAHNGCSTWPGWAGCAASVMSPGSADWNGDGLADLVWLQLYNPAGSPNRALAVWSGNGAGGFTQITASTYALWNHASHFVNVNGDGNTDILWDSTDGTGRSTGSRTLWLSLGNGLFNTYTNVSGQNGTLVGYRPYFGDFNGDGILDILWDEEGDGGTSGTAGGSVGRISGPSTGDARVLWLGKGDGTFTVITNYAGMDGTLIGYVPTLGDFNGDGKTDILWDSRSGTPGDTRSSGTRVLWLSDGVAPDLLASITTGIGATVAVTYKPLTDGSVYTKATTALDPLIDVQGAMFVVSRVDAGNGLGGLVSSAYAYAGAKADMDGRGFLGFRQMTVTDLQTSIVATTTYRQDYPFLPLVAGETKKLGALTLNATSNAYSATALGGTRYRVTLAQSQAASADLDGSVLPVATSAYQYDTFGNATQIVVQATDGFSKTTTNTYTNDSTNWLLGRLTNASVLSVITSPAPPPAQAPTHVVVTTSTNNLNVWNYLLSTGAATAGVAGNFTLTIASGVVIGSASSTAPALDTGVFPSGSTLQIVNNGSIVGAGGPGGAGGVCTVSLPAPGAVGGVALRAQMAVSVVNNLAIWGGGGGGGGGAGDGNGAGGGAGVVGGVGGAGSYYGCVPGGTGTMTLGAAGGNNFRCPIGGVGGNPGLPGGVGANDIYGWCPESLVGAAGGAAGPAATGNALITWTTVGDRRGPLVN